MHNLPLVLKARVWPARVWSSSHESFPVISKMKSPHPILIAVATGTFIGAARWVFECLFVVPLVPDPQSPIWIMISSVVSTFIAVTIALTTWILLRGGAAKSAWTRLLAGIPLVALLAWYATGFLNLAQMRAALLDSANPNTSAARLRELADYKNGPGYEIDNRIASHPNTPPDVLRSLHGRPDQVGTEMCLARNPNTPDDVLRAIAAKKGEWSKYYDESLKRNPRYDEVFRADPQPKPE